MEAYNQFFIHYPEHRIVICKPCKFAVPPQQIRTHFNYHHKDILVTIRHEVHDIVNAIDGLIREENEITYPDPTTPPISGLPVFRNALTCTTEIEHGLACNYTALNITSIYKHLQEKHGWINPRKRGGNRKNQSKVRNDPWQTGQTCQRFFEWGPWKHYFLVTCEIDSRHDVDEGDIHIVNKGEALLDAMEAQERATKKARVIKPDLTRYDANAWLEHVSWDHHLAGFTKEMLLGTVLPAKDEEMYRGPAQRVRNHLSKVYHLTSVDTVLIDDGLAQACFATEVLVQNAHATCRTSLVGKEALRYANRREVGEKNNEKPLYSGHKPSTVRRYTETWKRILRYLWRTNAMQSSDHPPYQLTPIQARSLRLVKERAVSYKRTGSTSRKSESFAQLEEAILEFWYAMFDHKLSGSEFDSGIISALAVLGIHPQTQVWVDALSYTPILSAVVSVMRWLVVYRAWQQKEQSITINMESGMDKAEATRNAASIVEAVQNMVHECLVLTTFGGKPTPMGTVLHTRTYGFTIRFNTKTHGRISWPRPSVIAYDTIQFSMDQLRTVVHGLHESARVMLFEDLLLLVTNATQLGSPKTKPYMSPTIPKLDINSLADNMAEFNEDSSFLDDPRNTWEVIGKRWMWKRAMTEKKIQNKFGLHFEPDPVQIDDFHWNRSKVEDYFKKVTRFKEELFALVHLSSGAPGRGTEVISVRHRNGDDGKAQRGIFIHQGKVAFVTNYHKGFSLSHRVKVIHRFVPNEVGELVVYYLWLVHPWVELLQRLVRRQEEFTPYMWEPDPSRDIDEDISDDEVELEEEEEGEGEGEEEQSSEESSEEDELLDDDGRSRAINARKRGTRLIPRSLKPKAKNVDGFWNTDRVRRVLQRSTMKRIGVGLNTAAWRQMYPAIQREITSEKEVVELLGWIYDGVQAGETDDFAARQSGHSKRTEETSYGAEVTESPFFTLSEQRGFRKVSLDWHRFLRWGSAWNPDDVGPLSRDKMLQQQEEAVYLRQKALKRLDIHKALKKLYGNKAEFRGSQQRILEAIVARQPRILVIMPTSGGKSLSFMLLAASSPDGITVVIVPLLSLRQDMMDRCDKDGISCTVWETNSPPHWASIVLVIPEAATSAAFRRFVSQKSMMGQLDRIVLDECHLMLDVTDTWRTKMRELKDLFSSQTTQILCLTATLPPRDQPAFFESVGFEPHSTLVFRDSTTRTNIHYKTIEYDATEKDETIIEIVDQFKKRFPLPNQMIVYGSTVREVKHTAELLRCSAYYSDVGDLDMKRQLLKGIQTGIEHVIAATSALGLGVDIPHVRLVLHTDMRRKIRDYVQESGRAGRDGEKSYAMILRRYKTDNNGNRRYPVTYGEFQQAMRDFISQKRCKRVVLDQEMDGDTQRTRCRPGEEACDFCCVAISGRKRTASPEPSTTLQTRQDIEIPYTVNEIMHATDLRDESGGAEEQDDDCDLVRVLTPDPVLPTSSPDELDAVEERDNDYELVQVPSLDPTPISSPHHPTALELDEAKARAEFAKENYRLDRLRLIATRRRIAEQFTIDELDQVFQKWQGVCPVCKHHGYHDSNKDHKLADCTDGLASVAISNMSYLQEIQFPKFSSCFNCWAPQALCNSWEERWDGGYRRYRRNKGVDCQFKGILLQAMASLLCDDEVELWVYSELEKHNMEYTSENGQEVFKQYLSMKGRVSDMEITHMVRAFYVWGNG